MSILKTYINVKLKQKLVRVALLLVSDSHFSSSKMPELRFTRYMIYDDIREPKYHARML